MSLYPSLVRRLEEEKIAEVVALPDEWVQTAISETLGETELDAYLSERGWTEADLRTQVVLAESLRRFADQRFGPGVEEQFLASRGAYDTIIYSLIRSRDHALIRELWIRIEEGETSFAEAAKAFGEGPEAKRMGLIGPLPIGQLAPPQFADFLRGLQPGSISPPKRLGDWSLLLRLEELKPACFDAEMRSKLVRTSLDEFLERRVRQRLAGESLETLTYHQDP